MASIIASLPLELMEATVNNKNDIYPNSNKEPFRMKEPTAEEKTEVQKWNEAIEEKKQQKKLAKIRRK